MPQGGCKTGRGEGCGVGGKIKWRLFEVNTRAVSRGLDKLIGKFKMAAGDVISIRGASYGEHVHSNRNQKGVGEI